MQRLHEGSREEVREWKQQLLDKWMAPEKGNKLHKGRSMIQKDLWGDTNQSKKRARKKKKACEHIDSNQRNITNWFCKIQKEENIQEWVKGRGKLD